MTVASATDRVSYATNGATTAFAVPFYFLEDGDLLVTYTDPDGTPTDLTITADYTVSGAGDENGGAVTTVATYPTGGFLVIKRNVAITQETAFPANTPLPSDSLERAFDKLTMIDQQLQEQVDRCFSVPDVGDTISPELPVPVAGALLSWNETGTAIVNTGSVAAGGGTFIQPDTGAVPRAVNDKLTDVVHVKDFGAVGDGVTDDAAAIQTAINAVSVAGGVLRFGAANYAIGSTLLVTASNVSLVGQGADAPHDGGAGAGYGTLLTWTGAVDGTMLKFETPSGTGNAKREGGGVTGMLLDCQSSAAIGLHLHSYARGMFRDVHVSNATVAGYKTSCYASGALAEASDTQQNVFEQCSWRMIANASVQSADGFLITSDTPGAGANSSFNQFRTCYGETYNGSGFHLVDADNNRFYGCQPFVSGAGYAVLIEGAYSNSFFGHGGATRIKGLASGAWQDATLNVFLCVDDANSSPVPTADTNCTFQWHSTKYGWYKLQSAGLTLAQTQANAVLQAPNLGTDTLRVHNTSQAGIALSNGTSDYKWSQDGNSNLRLTNYGGTGVFDLSQGGGVALKAKTAGFNGTAPISKPTVTGSKGSNAALTSLLSALAAYGLVTDSTT